MEAQTTQLEVGQSLEGRWDLEMDFEGKIEPSWLEIRHSGHETYVGRFVFAFGSARLISGVAIEDNNFSFSIPRQWEPKGQEMVFKGDIMVESNRYHAVYGRNSSKLQRR